MPPPPALVMDVDPGPDVSAVPTPPGLIWNDADEEEVLASYDQEKKREDEEPEDEGDAEEAVWYVCEKGCGFESKIEAVVEKHEATCKFVEE